MNTVCDIDTWVNELSHHIPGFLSGISMYHVPLPVEFLVGAISFGWPRESAGSGSPASSF